MNLCCCSSLSLHECLLSGCKQDKSTYSDISNHLSKLLQLSLLFSCFSSKLWLYKTNDVKIYWSVSTQRITSCSDVATGLSELLQLCVSVYVSFHFIIMLKQRNNGLLLKASNTNVTHLVLVDDHRPHSWLKRSAASGSRSLTFKSFRGRCE